MITDRFESSARRFAAPSRRRALGAVASCTAALFLSAPALATNAADETFLTAAGQGSMAEVAAGKLAASRTTDPTVKAFAARMIAEHSKADEIIAAIAKKNGLTPPAGVGARNEKLIHALSELDGKTFDTAYIRSQVQAHEKMEQIFQKEISSGSNPNLVAFAKMTLPKIQEHLSLAKSASTHVEASTK